MTTFRFPLQKVLEWRRTQLELEEIQYRRQVAALAELDRQRAELEESGKTAERQVREWDPLAGGDLGALGGVRLHVQQRERGRLVPRAACTKRPARWPPWSAPPSTPTPLCIPSWATKETCSSCTSGAASKSSTGPSWSSRGCG